MTQRRVVITGLGWATSLGSSIDQVWKDLVAGRSGIRHVTGFDTTEYKIKFGGEIANWDGQPHIESQHLKRLDKFTQYAICAAADAVQDSGLDFEKEDRWRCGAIVGTGIGGIETMETSNEKLLNKGPNRVSPFFVPKTMCNAASGNISIRYGLRGPNFAVASACASAAHAIGIARNEIRHNQAEVFITGGSEAAMTPLSIASFAAMKALSKRNDDPPSASRPFDRDRDGFVLSEGAGIIVLEEFEHARARGANIYAEVLGYGQSADGSHITAPDAEGRGASHAMEIAIRDSGRSATDIDYVNAHGTGTPLGDAAETIAIKKVFGHEAKSLSISSTKSMTGHLLGASGGIEAIISALAIRSGTLPPTINLDNPDEACDLDYIPHTAREKSTQVVMSNSFGFGGHNVSLIFGKI